MNHQINTIPIIEEFSAKTECPICEIKRRTNNHLLVQFSNEAVMNDKVRQKVNQNGFCSKHFSDLLDGENKLGLALQTQTRLAHLTCDFEIDSKKKVKHFCKKLDGELKKCLLCDLVEDNMIRYYKTCAELYYNDAEFRDIFANSKGVCLVHYVELVRYSKYAKSKQDEYLKTLSKLQKDNFNRLSGELQWFIDKFDYKNSDKNFGTAEDAHIRAINKYVGKIK